MMKKREIRAQATLFIILGILALVLVGSLVYYSGLLTKTGILSNKPGDPVAAYTYECIDSIAKQGIVILGQQGGYIYLDQYPLEIADKTPFNSGALKVSETSLIPYWYYQKDAGLDRSEMPQLEKISRGDSSIQDQLERYVLENLPGCLNNYAAFKEQGITVESSGEPDAEIIFTDKDVVVTVTYPITAKSDGEAKSFDKFNVNIDARVKEAYTFAKDIVTYEQTTTFLEQNGLNLVTVYGRVDKDYLPPLFGGLIIDDCGKLTYWMEDDVISNFKQILTLNLPFLRIQNSDFDRIIVSKEDQPDEENRGTMQGIFDMMTKKVSEKDYSSFNVLFEYQPSFPLMLDLGQKGMIRPSTQIDFNYIFGRKCLFMYKFAYTFKYPILVTLVDKESSINQQPLVFHFPIQVVTKANFPRVSVKDALGLEDQAVETYLCQDEQKNSGESEISIIDKDTSKPVGDAMIYYQCGPAVVEDYDENGTLVSSTPFSDRCFIGKTNEKGVMLSKFPSCMGGATVIAEKQGYAQNAFVVGDVMPEKKFSTVMELTKMRKLKLNLLKYYVIPPVSAKDFAEAKLAGTDVKQGIVLDDANVVKCNLYTPPTPLDADEEAFVTLKRLDPSIGSSNPYIFAMYNKQDGTEVEISPGTYQVEIMLVRNQRWKGELDVKKDSESFHIPGTIVPSKAGKDIYYPDDDMKIESITTGGALYITTIEDSMMGDATDMTLYLFDEGKPDRLENYFVALGHREACSNLNYNKIKPTFEG